MARIDDTDGRYASTVQEGLAKSFPIDGIVGGLPDQLVVPWGFAEVETVWPAMRVGAEDDLKAGLPQAGDPIRRGHFDPVHLPGAQRGQPRGGLRHGE